jgi:26S proteasome regulatory subunit N2
MHSQYQQLLLIANSTSQPPNLSFTSNAKPSLFAYPPTTKEKQKAAPAKVATAVLSTTAKVKAREKKKAAEAGEAMETVGLVFFAVFIVF